MWGSCNGWLLVLSFELGGEFVLGRVIESGDAQLRMGLRPCPFHITHTRNEASRVIFTDWGTFCSQLSWVQAAKDGKRDGSCVNGWWWFTLELKSHVTLSIDRWCLRVWYCSTWDSSPSHPISSDLREEAGIDRYRERALWSTRWIGGMIDGV